MAWTGLVGEGWQVKRVGTGEAGQENEGNQASSVRAVKGQERDE